MLGRRWTVQVDNLHSLLLLMWVLLTVWLWGCRGHQLLLFVGLLHIRLLLLVQRLLVGVMHSFNLHWSMLCVLWLRRLLVHCWRRAVVVVLLLLLLWRRHRLLLLSRPCCCNPLTSRVILQQSLLYQLVQHSRRRLPCSRRHPSQVQQCLSCHPAWCCCQGVGQHQEPHHIRGSLLHPGLGPPPPALCQDPTVCKVLQETLTYV